VNFLTMLASGGTGEVTRMTLRHLLNIPYVLEPFDPLSPEISIAAALGERFVQETTP